MIKNGKNERGVKNGLLYYKYIIKHIYYKGFLTFIFGLSLVYLWFIFGLLNLR